MSEERLRKRVEREKNARLAAEEILEQKSRELFERNQELKSLSETLEKQVVNRTRDLIQARDEALAAAKAKSLFMANMSHEIRTPLNGVLGMINMLFDTKLRDNQRTILQTAKSSGEHLLEIVNDILDFSKIDAGEMHLNETAVDMVDLVKQTTDSLQSVAEEKEISLTLELPESFPAFILADPLRVRQILTNLLSNAIKFTEVGNVQATLLLQHSNYVLQVKDSGIGMSDEHISQIFKAFGQADGSITRRFGGTGLGLTITQNFVHLMGGEISVLSTIGEGSTFVVTLPLEITDAPTHKPMASVTESTLFKPAHVLLVEDNDINLEIAEYLLDRAGLVVSSARNGQEAVDAVKEKSFQLVLMDIQMPVLDGLAATKAIRELGFSSTDLPIIAMTAHATHEHRKDSLKAGMNQHLTKPLNPIELFKELSLYLDIEQLERAELSAVENTVTETSEQALNVTEALKRLGGNEMLFQRLCTNFYQTHQNSLDVLESHLTSQNIEDAKRLAHTLKGSAANLSAKPFSQAAALLESALKQNGNHVDQELSALRTQWAKLSPVLQEQNASGEQMQDAFVPEQWLQLVTDMQQALTRDLSAADQLLQSMQKIDVPKTIEPLLNQLKDAMNQFDTVRAAALLNDLHLEATHDG